MEQLGGHEQGLEFILSLKLRVDSDLRKSFALTFLLLGKISHTQRVREAKRPQVWKMGVGWGERRPLGFFLETGSAFCQEGGAIRMTSAQSQGRGCQGQISVRDSLRDCVCEPLVAVHGD